LTVGTTQLSVPHFSHGIVDSGTTLLVVSTPTYAALKKHFQRHHCAVPGLCPKTSTEKTWFSPKFCVRGLTPEHFALLPTLRFNIDNLSNPAETLTLSLTPADYMLSLHPASSPILTHCLGIRALASLNRLANNVIIGNTALRNKVVAYDRDNHRVGFADARSGCGVAPAAKSGGGGSAGGHIAGEDAPGSSPRTMAIAGIVVGVSMSMFIGLFVLGWRRKEDSRDSRGYSSVESQVDEEFVPRDVSEEEETLMAAPKPPSRVTDNDI